jgi:hypothetical protein
LDKNTWLIRLAENPIARFWQLDFEQLTRAEQVFRTIWELEGQVNNGGFEQYFYNSGELAWFAPTALETIGATKMASIVQKACDVFPAGRVASDDAQRMADLAALDADQKGKFAALDEEFFVYPDDLTSLLFDYVAANRDQISGAT